ncbi:Tim44/TimA family putative adaptor protein [Bartonella sp. TP]|uniref:Tim44/TimA family putative adaptor protein n=1 Tax=Bartonella sp. TP TaxID=3057550 RepID=UPI0025B035A2|nr:Tim44/TimA family putative adaptor protein [Bartonella sp. TP]MDN5248616.1 Tim44/TimA family putative adaptor protein [Alphaproteobacteria bacterium]WJW80429.1 Tim44/TimA family putative adaptor protein [Bartonella sp. TP]
MDLGLIIIILCVMIIAIVAFQFNRVLGKRTGTEKPLSQLLENSIVSVQAANASGIEQDAEGSALLPQLIQTKASVLEDIDAIAPVASPLNEALRRIYDLDRHFSPKTFIAKAVSDYERVLESFAKLDQTVLHTLLSQPAEAAFEQEVAKNLAEGIKIDFSYVGNDKAQIIDAQVNDQEAFITLHFVSEVVLAIYNKAGELMKGSAKDLSILDEKWTFARRLTGSSTPWLVCATAPVAAV